MNALALVGFACAVVMITLLIRNCFYNAYRLMRLSKRIIQNQGNITGAALSNKTGDQLNIPHWNPCWTLFYNQPSDNFRILGQNIIIIISLKYTLILSPRFCDFRVLSRFDRIFLYQSIGLPKGSLTSFCLLWVMSRDGGGGPQS